MSKPKLSLKLILVLTFLAILPQKAYAKTMTIKASSDAVVSSYTDPDAGDGGNLHVMHRSEKSGDDYALTLIKFDISGIPESVDINTATLKLFATNYGTDGDSPSDLKIDRNIQDWSEGSVLWASKPSSVYLNEKSDIGGAIEWVSFDVKETVESWVSGEHSNYGFKLRPGDDDFDVKFSSSERSSNAPVLLVNYDVIEVKTPPADLTAPLITDVVTSDVTTTTAKVTYVTNEPATSRIEYGDFSTTESFMADDTLKTSHEFNLEDLTPNASYLFGLRAVDAAGNEGVNSVFSIVTLPLVEGTPPPPDGFSPGINAHLPADTTPPDTLIVPATVEEDATEENEESEKTEEIGETSVVEDISSGIALTSGIESIDSMFGGNGTYVLLGLLVVILVLLVVILVIIKKKKKSNEEEETLKEKITEMGIVDIEEEKKSKKGLILVLIVSGLIAVLAGVYYVAFYVPENKALEEQGVVTIQEEEAAEEVAEEVATTDLEEPLLCSSGVLNIHFYLFEEGWTCERQDNPEVNGGLIRATSDTFTITISNLGRGGYCMGPMGGDEVPEDYVCNIQEITLTDSIAVKKYTDVESGEIFGTVQLAENPWISIGYTGISTRDMSEAEMRTLLRILDSLATLR
jgi:flagellar basal body-associated protein FliL